MFISFIGGEALRSELPQSRDASGETSDYSILLRQPSHEGNLAHVVEFISRDTDGTKVFGEAGGRGQIGCLVGQGLLVCPGKISSTVFCFIMFLFLLVQCSLSSKSDWACFQQLSDAAVELFNSISAKDGFILHIGASDGLDSLTLYIEKWRMQIWDAAFPQAFRGQAPFTRGADFNEFKGVEKILKRVIYR